MSQPISPFYEDDFVTLYHGDCREVIPRLDLPLAAVVTDPPYGIAWKKGENKAAKSRAHKGIIGDGDTVLRDLVLAMLSDVPAAVFGSFYAPQPLRTRQVLVWEKPVDAGVVGSTTGFRRDVEPVFLVGDWPHRTCQWGSVLRPGAGSIAHTASATGHPHTKPVPLMRELVARCPEGTIIDPFAGSGSTLRAAKDLGRKAIGIEIDADYCRIAADRCAQDNLFAEAA